MNSPLNQILEENKRLKAQLESRGAVNPSQGTITTQGLSAEDKATLKEKYAKLIGE